MRIDQRFLNWGLFFILLGAVPLAVQQGVINRDLVVDWWRLWPLLIVGVGVGILLRRTPAAFAGGLVVAATLGLMIGGLLAVGGTNFGDIACGGTSGTSPFAARSAQFAGSAATVRLDLNCGDLTVTSGAETGWTLSGSTHDGQPPDVNASGASLSIVSRDSRGDGFLGFGRFREDWNLAVPGTLAVSLDATLNAGRGTFNLAGSRIDTATVHGNAGQIVLDLSETSVRDVELTVNAGSGQVSLPAADVSARFEVNAGSISFCVPDGVGLQIRTNDNITAGNNFGARGLQKSGSTWTSSGYETASRRIGIDATANAAGFTLNPEEGCR